MEWYSVHTTGALEHKISFHIRKALKCEAEIGDEHLTKLDISTFLVEKNVYVAHNQGWCFRHVSTLKACHLCCIVIQAVVFHLNGLSGCTGETLTPPATYHPVETLLSDGER